MGQEDQPVLPSADKHEPKPGLTWKLNLTEISADDYLAMKHDFEQSFGIGDAIKSDATAFLD